MDGLWLSSVLGSIFTPVWRCLDFLRHYHVLCQYLTLLWPRRDPAVTSRLSPWDMAGLLAVKYSERLANLLFQVGALNFFRHHVEELGEVHRSTACYTPSVARSWCHRNCGMGKRFLFKYNNTHTFNGPFSGTTQASRYQKGITNLDFTEARDSDWQWHQLGHMQVCTSLQTDNHASTPPLKFLQARYPSCRPTNSIKALKAIHHHCNQTWPTLNMQLGHHLKRVNICIRLLTQDHQLPQLITWYRAGAVERHRETTAVCSTDTQLQQINHVNTDHCQTSQWRKMADCPSYY